MGWMDRLTNKMTQQRAITGTALSPTTVESAMYGGLKEDYDLSFKRGTIERQVTSSEKLAAEQRAIEREKLALSASQFDDKMGLEKDARTSQAITGITTAALTNADKIGDFASKTKDWFSGLKSSSTLTPGAEAAISSTESYGAAVAGSAMTTPGITAVPEIAEVGAVSPSMFGFASAEGTLAATVESTVAHEWAAAGLGQLGMVGAGEAGAATGVAATATETSMLASFGQSLSLIGSYVPFVGLAFAAASFIFPGFGEKVTDAIGDAATSVWNAVTSVFDGSVVCTELERQGYLPFDVLFNEGLARMLYIDENAYRGYLRLFKPYVRLMQKKYVGKFFTLLILPFGRAIAYELANKVNESYKPSKLGKIILKFGLPVCRFVNKIAEREKSIDMRCLNGCY